MEKYVEVIILYVTLCKIEGFNEMSLHQWDRGISFERYIMSDLGFNEMSLHQWDRGISFERYIM